MDELALIVMASGFSTRFNGNKLLCDVGGKPMIRRVLEAIPPGYRVAVVTRYALVKALALEMGFAAIDNSLPDLRDTIRLGLDALDSYPAACFMVGDQPWITKETLAGMRMDYINHPGSIVRAAYNGKPGNPVIFPRALFPELKSLAARESGSSVIKRHGDLTRLYPASERELCDVDRINDLKGGDTMAKQTKPPMPETKLLTTVFSRVESDMIRELLKNADIPTLVQPKFGLDRMPVLAGSSALGEEIYVFEDKYEEAKDILDGFTKGEFTQEDAEE